MNSEHAAIVLAAGGSCRLGRAKQLLRRGGEFLVHRATRLALATSPRRLLVVLGAEREEIAHAVDGLGAEHVFNPAWKQGLASSLRVAMSKLTAHRGTTLVVGCDQPALELRHLQLLLAGAHASSSDCAATTFVDGRLGVPVAVSPSVLHNAYTMAGDRGFGALLSHLPGIWCLEAPELRMDVDVEGDVVRAVALGWLDQDAIAAAGPAHR